MSSAFLISLVIQVLLIIHCIRTGRNSLWIWAIALLPLAGPIAYVLIELLPGLFASRGTRRAVRGMRKVLDPEQDLRRYQDEARLTGDVASRQRFADELVRHGRSQEAAGIYRQALTGLYEHDPNLMLGLARALFASGAFSEARSTLDALIAHNPDFRSPDGHLLYARALEGEGNRDKALAGVCRRQQVLRRRRGGAALRPAAARLRQAGAGTPRAQGTAGARAAGTAPLPQDAAGMAGRSRARVGRALMARRLWSGGRVNGADCAASGRAAAAAA